ncbi:aromatic amino acid ammonia-lyase [Massilia sp. IC2-477]|uniref:HAL/PAL/TAL family ammonia-lyase n=1 Tax=Massilia sp. IC2-477 TaxID=2887198 RepID=UPI001D107522|nr:aromatic amino acid ammonia-lyase [Massilia sp. IC2-477]MCC2958593.1 aromatic amino acid ammonia-lyase [Massilia sp. IC2-477]
MRDTHDAAAHDVRFGAAQVAPAEVVALARGQARAALSDDPAFVARITAGAELLDRILREDGVIYGVTTGYGDSCDVAVPPDLVDELPHRLFTYHGCGMGASFTREETRAILAVRLASLCRGSSGVSIKLLQALSALLERDVLPVIPSEGSVGASGDLTPLSYVAAVLCGEREAWPAHGSTPVAAAAALDAAGLAPIRLRPKEGLALMNGTAAMTGLACLATARAESLCGLASRITALSALALESNAYHFDPTLFAAKPYPGMARIAASIAADLGYQLEAQERNSARLQDRYSIRCAPHVIGVLADALPWMRSHVELELNSANDNPLVDVDSGRVLHGGHFYGGHMAFAMDSMKNAVANIADLLDRQMALLVDSRYNNGLPSNLRGAQGERAAINHGLKALQISVSAWTAEALKLTMPASVFSRSTECHNQDKVSMGTIAARDCLRIIALTEQVAAALLIATRQACALRYPSGLPDGCGPGLRAALARLEELVPFVKEDRRLDLDLARLLEAIRADDPALLP